ncbi:MAG: serine/threonine-protein phosphatase [Lachnospiraceae bacterium]|nr:serine/threonine-protein phosphatase [Lachnospiraceae bacterium]
MGLSIFGKKEEAEYVQPLVARPRVQRQLSYRIANLQGVGARARQEDSFAVANAMDVSQIREQGLFFAVCDGMGGMKDGKLGSETAIASLRTTFMKIDRNGDIAAQLKQGIYTASEEVEAVIGGEGGSTAIACIIYQEKLYYAGVGDSFLYLLRDGQLYRINREQNVCHRTYLEVIREGGIDPADYQDMDEAGALTEFLGMIGLEDVDWLIRPMPLQNGDVLLACSDGVGGVLEEDEVRMALTLPTEQEMCNFMEQRLIDHARRNQDNYTALVVKCVY